MNNKLNYSKIKLFHFNFLTLMQVSFVFILSSNKVSPFRPLGEPLFNLATENCRPDNGRTLWISPSESL